PAGTPAPAGLSTPGWAYAALLGLTLLNPATIVYFAALVLGRQAADSDSGAGGGGFGAGAALFVVGAFVASASWQLLIAGGGVLVGRVLAGPTGRRATALLSAAMILALAVFMVVPR
ncbi:MAG TPA: lysine transporter LysE, partial [Pilimelia sp.]|nr:lysine transporter LysE [Pilimelia sp.]